MSDLDSKTLFHYVLRLGDNNLILAQRISEWNADAPEMEEDIALTNIALDLLGQARALLTYAGEIEGAGRDEDKLAFHRDSHEFGNVLLAEQLNGDFAQTIARQYLIDAFHQALYAELIDSRDETLAAIAAKAIKENAYHLRHSRLWLLRLGDGTEESHRRMQKAIDDMWPYTGELFSADEIDQAAIDAGVGADLSKVQAAWRQEVEASLKEATLAIPAGEWMDSGGKQGRHSEHLGFLLAEMQFLQRAYPGCEW